MAGGGEDGTEDVRTGGPGPDGEGDGRASEAGDRQHDGPRQATGDRVGSNPAKVSVEPYSLPLSRPLSTASGTIETRRGFLVRVRTDGVRGVGEAAPLPDFTESYEACEAALATASDVAAHHGLEAAHDAIDPGAHSAAAHGFATACLDAVGKAVDQPLYRLLGGEWGRERLPVNAVVGDGTPDQTADRAAAAVEAGFDCVKIKVGAREPAVDAARLRAVRAAIGPDPTLRADANGAWSRGQAQAALQAFEGVDLQYVEQPLGPGDLQGCAALRDGPVPIAIDEGLTVHGVEEVLAAGAADALVVKPMVHGSPAAARGVATQALDAGLIATVTTTVDAVVARTAAVHVAASLPEVTAAGLATADRLAADLGADPAPVSDGAIAVPQESGLGLGEVST